MRCFLPQGSTLTGMGIMTRGPAIRILFAMLIGILIINSTACTASRPIQLPPGDDPDQRAARVGDRVTVTLVDGTRHTGDVVRVSSDELVFGRAGNYGWEETAFPAAKIAAIEVQTITTLTRVVIVVTAVLLVASIVLGALYAASLPVTAS